MREAVEKLRARHDSSSGKKGTPSDVARQLGVSQPSARAWIAGTSSPSIPELDKIAQHLETTELELRKGTRGRLEIALSYNGRDKWPDRVIRRARDLADDGLELSCQQWAAKLDELVKLPK